MRIRSKVRPQALLHGGMLIGLLLLVITTPLIIQSGNMAPSVRWYDGELGLTPRAGGWSYFTSLNRSEPLTERTAILPVGATTQVTVGAAVVNNWFAYPRATVSYSYRQQYLVPRFNSTYT